MWPVLNRRAREIETDLWRSPPKQGDFTEKGSGIPITPGDRATAQALMVWSDDGGLTA